MRARPREKGGGEGGLMKTDRVSQIMRLIDVSHTKNSAQSRGTHARAANWFRGPSHVSVLFATPLYRRRRKVDDTFPALPRCPREWILRLTTEGQRRRVEWLDIILAEALTMRSWQNRKRCYK
ncbi:unnamed protein product [Ascophyllum nodosum]